MVGKKIKSINRKQIIMKYQKANVKADKSSFFGARDIMRPITPQELNDRNITEGFFIFIPKKRLFFFVDNADYEDKKATFYTEMMTKKGVSEDIIIAKMDEIIFIFRP